MASGHVCTSFVDMDYRASHEIQHTYLTRAPTQPDAIHGTAGMSSVYLFFGKIAKTQSQEC